MRLIDADELLQTVSIKSVFGNEINKMKCGELRKILEMIENAPTVEPQKKRGKWKGYNAEKPDWQRTDGSPVFLVCSECGAIVVNNFAAKWNYCCVCGADMRGQDDES